MRHRYRYNLNNDTDNNSKDKATTSGTRSTSMRMESKIIILCIMFAIATGGLLVLFSKNQLGLGYFYLRPSSSSKADDSASNEYEYERRKEQQLEEVTELSMEIEEDYSRAYPIWIDKRRAIDSSSSSLLYDWCVSEDLVTNNDDESESPTKTKGLLFVKVHKSGSSTGAGVTLRIRDGLSKRLNRITNQNQNKTTHDGTCFAHYQHATARELNFQNRDPAQSFLWSIVREPAQRTLSAHFFYYVSKPNHTATGNGILNALESSKGHNYQSKYLDLPIQNEQSSSSTDRIINGYDFLAVNERMEESLVVLAMLAQIPLTDVVVFSSKLAGGYHLSGIGLGCLKLKKKWTTPKIEEYILGDYRSANKDDRSLDKTIDALGRQRVEDNVKLLRNLQQQNEEQCASKVTLPCPEPEDDEKKQEHSRLVRESCYFSDIGCGHACTDLVLADHAEKEWANITSLHSQG